MSKTTQYGVRLRVGNQTAFSAAHPLDPFRFALSHGFDAFEWFSDRKGELGFDWGSLSDQEIAWIRAESESRNMSLAVHSPWQSTPMDALGREALLQSIEFARAVGARIVVLHIDPQASAEVFAERVDALARTAAESGIRLALENTVHSGPGDCNRFFAALRARGLTAEYVGMCLDIGHANVCRETRNDYVRFFRLLDPAVEIIHCHFHENWGDGDQHLLLFSGPAGQNTGGIEIVIEGLAARGFTGIITLEVWPNPPEGLVTARERLRGLVARRSPALLEACPTVAPEPAPGPEQPAEAVQGTVAEQSRGSAPEGPKGAVSAPSSAGPRGSVRPVSDAVGTLTAFQEQLVAMSTERRSWRRRLEWVRDRLAEPATRQDADRLSDIASYLRLVGTGAVTCSEDGGHFRPSHHAAFALDIERFLLESADSIPLAVVRRIIRWLPSHDAPFRRAEPLTRIRDIAHRGDIPRELKEEIKHNLQNKLHRSAGPEDLATSAGLLERINREESRYSPGFVAEFRTFHRELEDFFNAPSMERNLEALGAELGGEKAGLVRALMASRTGQGTASVGQAPGNQRINYLMEELRLGVALRQELVPVYRAVGDPISQRQRVLDQQLEERAFSILSELANQVEAHCGAPESSMAVRCLALGLRHVALSGVAPRSAAALAEAMESMSAGALSADGLDREAQLRLLGYVGAINTVVTRVMDDTLATFSSRVGNLGAALGVPRESVLVFAEGEIRGSVIFQVSRLAQRLQECLTAAIGGSPWEAIVPGTATGDWMPLGRLAELPMGPGPWIVALNTAEGDESIPPSVRGIVVLHDLPILSHLAIRARQGGVVMCAARGKVERPTRDVGSSTALRVTRDGMELQAGQGAPPAAVPSRGSVQALPVAASAGAPIPLRSVELNAGGPKAHAARRLLKLTETAGLEFSAPTGGVLPFGLMEAALASEPAAHERYRPLLEALDSVPEHELDGICHSIQSVVLGLSSPKSDIQESLAYWIGGEGLWVVRSSANLEDLAGFSAAGLHDSVVGVRPQELAPAVRRVWASLHSGRAVRARRQAGVASATVRMAVLVQPLVPADACFVMFTKSPFADQPDRGYLELAAGQGEILCSASGEGTPLRVEFDRSTGESTVLSFPSYPDALRINAAGVLEWQPVQYASIPWIAERRTRSALVSRLAALAHRIEVEMGCPQDVEGAIVGNTIYVLQSRPAERG